MNRDFALNGKLVPLLTAAQGAITAAQTATYPGNGGAAGVPIGPGATYVGYNAVFTYTANGTTVKAWIQTSLDGGVTWFDIINVAFTTASLNKWGAVSSRIVAAAPATPTNATLADNTINNGILGDRIRLKLTTTGTYDATATLKVDLVVKA